jgi:hypothetical protein
VYPTWHYARLFVDPQPGCAPPAIDVALIHLVYEVEAPRTRCERCGSALRPQVTLVPGQPRGDDWRVVVQARCGSWRRHRSHAVVTPDAGGLRLGPLRAA